MSAVLKAEVVIVGAGPCGVTLANHLGVYGIRTLVLERSEEVLDYPRAVGADDEALRSWQSVGLAEDVLSDVIQNVPARYYDSQGYCLAEVAPGAQPYGWPRRNLIIQPLTETTLRKGLERFNHVDVRLGVEVTGLTQTDDGVQLQAKDSAGQELTVECAYAVGADGGRSTIRSLIGAKLEGKTHTNKWLVVDVLNDQLDAPYTAIHCHPVRPSISINLPYGYRRLEFQVNLDEDDDKVLDPANLERLMRPHYPDNQALPEIKRARIYLHHSRIADRFQVGRVFLAGDAAHLQPPFFGQGMNSGLRDATNLAWKLAWVIQGRANPRILGSYGSERRDHALAMVNFATWIGSMYKPYNRVTETIRTWFFKSIKKLPGAREYILQLKFKPMSRYTEGIVIHEGKPAKNSPVGRLFLQPTVEQEGRARKLDDVIGPAFAIIGINQDPYGRLDATTRDALRSHGVHLVFVSPSKSIRHLPAANSTSLCIQDLSGKFRDWLLANPEWQFVVLRPDRYVAAVCSAEELPRIADRFIQLLK